MAKQIGPVFITGTIGDICFYKLDGVYYARTKSSLSRKRVKKDPKFRRTMEYATLMASASRIASGIYRQLPAEKRKHALYRVLTGQALRFLKEALDAEEVKSRLYLEYIAPKPATPKNRTAAKQTAGIKTGFRPLLCARHLQVTAAGILRERKNGHTVASPCYLHDVFSPAANPVYMEDNLAVPPA